MKKFINVLLFTFIVCNVFVNFAQAKNIKAQVNLLQKLNSQYYVGDTVGLKFNSGNFTGKVQYRVLVEDLTSRKSYDLYRLKDKYYTGIFNSGRKILDVNYKFSKPGDYRFTIYVKKAGAKTNDSFVRTNIIKVTEKVVIKDQNEEKSNDKVEQNNNGVAENNNSVPNNQQNNSSENNSNSSSNTTSENSNNNSTQQQSPPEGSGAGGSSSAGSSSGTSEQPPVNNPQNNSIIKQLNVTLGNGKTLEGTVSGNNYNFDLRSLSDDDTVIKINFILNKDGVIEIAGKKFNAKQDSLLSINVPSDLGLPDNPPPGIQLGNVRQYDSTFSLTFTITSGTSKYTIGVNLKVK